MRGGVTSIQISDRVLKGAPKWHSKKIFSFLHHHICSSPAVPQIYHKFNIQLTFLPPPLILHLPKFISQQLLSCLVSPCKRGGSSKNQSVCFYFFSDIVNTISEWEFQIEKLKGKYWNNFAFTSKITFCLLACSLFNIGGWVFYVFCQHRSQVCRSIIKSWHCVWKNWFFGVFVSHLFVKVFFVL